MQGCPLELREAAAVKLGMINTLEWDNRPVQQIIPTKCQLFPLWKVRFSKASSNLTLSILRHNAFWSKSLPYQFQEQWHGYFSYLPQRTRTSLVAQMVKHLSAMQETRVWALGWEDPLEKEMGVHSSILAWKIPWTAEPGRLPSMGSQRVGHDWATSLSTHQTPTYLRTFSLIVSSAWNLSLPFSYSWLSFLPESPSKTHLLRKDCSVKPTPSPKPVST